MNMFLTEYESILADFKEPRPKLLIVRPTFAGVKLEKLEAILDAHNMDLKVISSYADLYSTISDTKQQVSVIGLDLISMANEGDDVWSIVHVIDTILKSIDSDAIIIGGATMFTPANLIKQFLAMGDRCVGIYPIGKEFTDSEKNLAISNFATRNHHIPEKIKNIIYPKKDTKTDIKLTPRQEQILNMIVTRGASNKMIARSLNITESTVKLHVAKLLQKFCAKNRTQLAVSFKNKV